MTEVASAVTITFPNPDETRTGQIGVDSLEGRHVSAHESSTNQAGEDPETAPQRAVEKLKGVSNRPRAESNVQENGHEDKERIPKEKKTGEYVSEEGAVVLGSTDVEKASDKLEKSISADVMPTKATEQQPNDGSEPSGNATGVVDSSESVTKPDKLVKEDTTEPVSESAPVHTSEPGTEPVAETSTQAGPEAGKDGLSVEAESTGVADLRETTTAVAGAGATDGKDRETESELVKESEERVTIPEAAKERILEKPVDKTSEPQHVEEEAKSTKENEMPVIAEHAAEPEASAPLAEIELETKPAQVPDDVAREEDAVEASDSPVVEAPAGGENGAQPEESNADAAAEPSRLEPTTDETTKASDPEVEASSDVPKRAEKTTAQEAPVKEEEVPVDGQPAEKKAPAPNATEDSALNAVGDADTKPQEAEGTVERRVDAGIGGESVTVKGSEPTEITPVASEGGKKPEEMVVAQAVENVTVTEPQVDASPPQAETAKTNEITARQTYELAHAHTNKEVSFDTPTDEELKAASLENVASEKGDEAGAVETSEPETEEEPQKVWQAAESQASPVSEVAAAPAPKVNGAEKTAETEFESKKEEGGPDASEEPQSETIKPLEEVVKAPEQQAETKEGIASDAKEGAVEAEVVDEGTADETDAAASAELLSEPQVVEQVASSDAPDLETQDDEPSAPTEVPSEEVTAVKKEVEDVSPTGPSENAIAHTEDAPTLTQEEASAPVEQVFVSEPATSGAVEKTNLDEAPVQVLPETDINAAEGADKEPPAAEIVAISEPVEQFGENKPVETTPTEIEYLVDESKEKDVSAEEVSPDTAAESVSAGDAQEVVEGGGAAELAATPAAGKPVPSEQLATNIDQVNGLLEEETLQQVAVPQEPAEVAGEATTTKKIEVAEIVEDAGVPESAEPAPQTGTEPEASVEERDLKTAAEAEAEEQEVDVPDVLVETPTPMSETLTISSDEEDDDAPLEERFAKDICITAGETAKSPALDTTSLEDRVEDEVVTPTKANDETISEAEGREVPAIEAEDLETPSQSVLLERPETSADDAATGPTTDAEAPERPKSHWTPSYSVTTQGSSLMHPQSELPPVTEDISNTSTGGAVEEKANIEADAISPASSVEDEQATDSALVKSSATDTPALETIATQTIPTETVPAVVTESEEPTYLSDAAVEQAPILATEDREITASDGVAAAEDIEVPVEAAPASLSVDTNVKEVPERPKSPWTPSYSVTKMGPGVAEPDELHLDQDAPVEDRIEAPQEIQQVGPSEAPGAEVNETRDAEEHTPDIERPKSLYPPAYSVTQMGPGAIDAVDSVPQLEEPTSPISESGPASVVDSNEPEAPLTPRSDLGIVTPGFDTLSEVSESSHIPMPPSSPRSDPETSSLLDDEVKTPLVTVPENQGESVSPLQTPLTSASKALESTEQLTESAVSGFDADVAHTSATDSWVKENSVESESRAEDSGVSPAAVDAVGVDQPTNQTAPPENDDTVKEMLQQNSAETKRAEESSAPPELSIPKLDVTPAPPAAQPLIVTNTFSTDSAYTQISDAFSPSQETETTMTTPDVESPPVSKLHPSSDLESEAATSDSTVRPSPNTPQKGKALGVTHTLAMRSFPSAFTDSETSPATEQPNQPPTTETHEVDDLLSPLSADARRRLESTVSSLAFPGGWVSSPRKERTSLEVATGEFSKPVVGGNPIVTPPIAEHPSEQKESKWRCVIM